MAAGQPIVSLLQQSSSFHVRASKIYGQLDQERRQTRLVNLHSARFEDPRVRVTLQVVSLDDAPEYEAISYAWETFSGTKQILLEDEAYTLTTNQYAALRRLRYADGVRVLWMDILSINQQDDAERSQQVSMMSEVYRNAKTTCIWIGEPDSTWIGRYSESDIEDDMQRLRENDLAQSFEKPVDGICLNHAGTVKSVEDALDILQPLYEGKRLRHMPFWKISNGALRLRIEWYQTLDTLIRILKRPWWSRVWVIQESLVSLQHAIVHIGPYQRPFILFVGAMIKPFRPQGNATHFGLDQTAKGKLNQSFFHSTIGVRLLANAAVNHITGKTSFSELMVLSATQQASDPRDHVYGIIGLAGATATRIPVRYDKPTSEVYALATFEALKSAGNLDHLCYSQCLHEPNEDGLPSWVRDWRFPPQDIAGAGPASKTVKGAGMARYPPFYSSPGVEFDGLDISRIRFNSRESELTVPGHKLAKVKHACKPSTLDRMYDKGDWNPVLVRAEWTKWLQEHGFPLGDEDFFRLTLRNAWSVQELSTTHINLLSESFRCWDHGPCDHERHLDCFSHLEVSARNASVFVTEDNRIGVGTRGVAAGDQIVVLQSYRSPSILTAADREDGKEVYRLVGDCYVRGLPKEKNFGLTFPSELVIG